ncbi:hypothetical protein PVL29_023410 [Vitis rotundifolia]|uniref:Uncharacterized protein n=1 Tax=Vitis rotundifolia TaxID=103349 RepID=A0AA38YNU6_VITRO|nr:hypothetical protein PVL29_023410 [Vitis rotundifolia]
MARLQQFWDLALQTRRPPLDVAEPVVCKLEDDPNFKADKSSVPATNGAVEMDAFIKMETRRSIGAAVGKTVVAGATNKRAIINGGSTCSGGRVVKPKGPYGCT